ncbi:transcription factor AP-4 [Tribolium castaneum]|uniref:Transcription factor AP-4-like Protein n=1 Tax=Tribolium castaneum TaxID=7070 RepID=D2A2G8_TRICA|nr:PREDICTED: transcription factor AP-4 [Tribolium castaneum]EFA02027.2 Transcription factor AP-4-like Protein [Tribolium castaneum]|eukprot:XP_967737.2 PREDICTED: transcription factor AP-4 [Tribolium castaneum]
MSVYVDEEQLVFDCEKKELLGNSAPSRINKGGEPPTATMEAEKRIRREIANSNERRRMQSINNGFQSLRSLLPHHEGEKLSKAAILQQTAEYIYSLEQEKTRLLSQNCQLKRLVSQHESGGGELPPKKRKTEIILPTITAESSDEGLGSMSPEPVGLITVNVTSESPAELRRQLERERGLRMVLEEQVRQFESQIYHQQQNTQPHTIYQVEGTEELALQLVSAECLPPVGHTQTVVCSPPVSRSPSPEPEQRLPSVLEAAIKAEPKVEVERLPSPNPGHEDAAPRLYAANTSRQNLETIVEAIRHLEGDHMFGDEPLSQEVPLALTKNERMNTLVEFSAAMVQQSQQSRPGVIVVKQAS